MGDWERERRRGDLENSLKRSLAERGDLIVLVVFAGVCFYFVLEVLLCSHFSFKVDWLKRSKRKRKRGKVVYSLCHSRWLMMVIGGGKG